MCVSLTSFIILVLGYIITTISFTVSIGRLAKRANEIEFKLYALADTRSIERKLKDNKNQ